MVQPKGLIAAALLCCLASLVHAEGAAAAPAATAAGPTLIPLPYAFYSPETSLAGGAILMLVSNSSPGDADQLENVARGGAFISLNGQAQAFVSAEHFLPRNQVRISLESHVGKMPNKFFGIGPSASSEEDYVPFECGLDATAGFLLAPGLYLGPRFRLFGSWMRERAPGGLLVQGAVPGADGTSIVGPGVRLIYEGRDSAVAPSRGFFLDFCGSYSFVTFGDGSAFPSFSIDARAYATPLAEWKVVLATQLYGALVSGSAPFQELPRLGGDELLRGYYDGRYRDKALVAAQTELRIPVWWRFGIALFGGAGLLPRTSPRFGSTRQSSRGALVCVSFLMKRAAPPSARI